MGLREVVGKRIWLDPCPDSVWEQLPGGPVAWNEDMGEAWQYMGTVSDPASSRHEFRHRAHPLFAQGRVNAQVYDDDGGPRLGRLVIRRWPSAVDDVAEGGDLGEI